MPSLPKSRKRPWRPQRKQAAPQEGRKIKNPFYQTMPWRKFRAQQKAAAIEKAETILQEIVAEGKPIPEAFQTRQPLCEICLKGNVFGPVYRAATVLDHIKPINPADAYDTMAGSYGEPLDPDNVQWLCEHHHAIKSGKEHKFHNK